MLKDIEKLVGEIGFSIYQNNSCFDKADVIVIGEIHNQYNQEIGNLASILMNDKDIFLHEELEKNELFYGVFKEYEGQISIPDKYSSLQSKKTIEIKGVSCISTIQDYVVCLNRLMKLNKMIKEGDESKGTTYLRNKVYKTALEKEQDVENNFYNVLVDNLNKIKIKDNKKIWFKMGKKHATSPYLINKLKDDQIKYLILTPKYEKEMCELKHLNELTQRLARYNNKAS